MHWIQSRKNAAPSVQWLRLNRDEAEVWSHRRRRADKSNLRLRFGRLEGVTQTTLPPIVAKGVEITYSDWRESEREP
jgi:hypothetical protein